MFFSIGGCSIVGDVALAAVSKNHKMYALGRLQISGALFHAAFTMAFQWGARTAAGFHYDISRAVPTKLCS